NQDTEVSLGLRTKRADCFSLPLCCLWFLLFNPIFFVLFCKVHQAQPIRILRFLSVCERSGLTVFPYPFAVFGSFCSIRFSSFSSVTVGISLVLNQRGFR